MSATILTATERQELARELLDGFSSNDWGGDSSVEEIASGAYAVRVEREGDSWILAAADGAAVAGIVLGTYVGTEGYDEWIDEIWDMRTGETVAHSISVSVAVDLAGTTFKS